MSISRVYKIINDVDDLVYIGSTRQILCKRLTNHRHDAKSGNEAALYAHMRKIGTERFKILCIREYKDISKERLKYKEDKYIKRFDTVKTGLNMIYAFGKICEHNKIRGRCIDCGGSAFCSHNMRKEHCKECKGAGLCQHNNQKHQCKECKGSRYCPHDKQKECCKECGGKEICSHDKIKRCCKVCSPAVCEICSKTFSGKACLKRHQKKLHPSTPVEN